MHRYLKSRDYEGRKVELSSLLLQRQSIVIFPPYFVYLRGSYVIPARFHASRSGLLKADSSVE